MTARLVIVGDTLLDRDLVGIARRLCPDAPVPVLEDVMEQARPGGAGLSAVLAAADGRPVTLVTALSGDAGGQRLRALLEDAGVAVVDLGAGGATAEKARVGTDGQVLLRLDSGPSESSPGPLSDAGRAALHEAGAVLVSDYGHGLAGEPTVRAALVDLPPRRPIVWDPHPRGADPVTGTRLLTPNAAEAGVSGTADLAQVTWAGRRLGRAWQAGGVAVTLGPRGAVLVEPGDGPPLVVAPPQAARGDTCGAGDRFAAAVAGLLADGALPSEAVTGAVRAASAFVAAGGAATLGVARPQAGGVWQPGPGFGWEGPEWRRQGPGTGWQDPSWQPADGTSGAAQLAAAVRASGRTVVAAGGCFDILHAGHVSLLQAARAQGDCLIVCLNSDASVRRLKGPGRPVQPEADRAAVLLALGCVDAVAVFDEDTPAAVLRRLRPHVFAKGSDYSLTTLPEAALLSEWDGQAVILPLLEGRSTTRVLKEAVRRAPT